LRNRGESHVSVIVDTPASEAELPPAPLIEPRTLQTTAQFGNAATIALVQNAYDRTCVACHGSGAVSGGIAPDLRYSATIAYRVA